MQQNIDLNKFPFKDENKNTLTLNFLSSVEAEKLFIETEGDDKIPYPFYFNWFEAMVEELKKTGDIRGLTIIIRTLYNTLSVNLPDIFDKIEANGFIVQFADELFADLDDIACEEYSGSY